ncbi:MAG TPA: MFS transporter [Candidatus Lokiarchaeia archaeon]|nr:MFS transporter [Candidatus Lokiarchaeia archaeon]
MQSGGECCGGRCNCGDRVLTGGRLVGFAFGTFGQNAPIGIFNMFAPYYYIYVIDLDPMLVFLGMLLSLLAFALSSPVFGVLSDNKKCGRIGKRRPFLLVGIPGLLVFMTLIWMPPQPTTLFTAVYFWVCAIGLEIFQSLLVSVYLAMMVEQSTDQSNRVKIATLQGIFSLLGTVLSILLPVILKSHVPEPGNPSWSTVSIPYFIGIMPWIGLAFGCIGFASFLVVFLSTDEKFFQFNRNIEIPKLSVTKTFKEMIIPFKDVNYRWWLGNAFFFNMAIRYLIFILLPVMDFVIILSGSWFMIFFACLLPVAAIGYIIWVKKIKTSGLKNAYSLSLVIFVLFSAAATIFLIPIDFTLRFILGVAIVGILISALVGGYLFPNPIISQLVDIAPEAIRKEAARSNKGIAGAYFGLYILVYNLANAIGNIILGLIFTDQTKNNPVIITLVIPLAGVMVFVSWLLLRRLELPHQQVIQLKSNLGSLRA